MLMAAKPMVPVTFPVLGIHEGVGYDMQPPGTTADALNVRGIDAIKNRLRGGRRPGLTKYHPDQIQGSAPIQILQKVIDSINPSATLLAVTDDFSSASYGTSGAGDIGAEYVRGVINSSTTDGTVNSTFDGTNDWLRFSRVRNGSAIEYNLLGVNFRCVNDCTAVIRANGVASTDNGGDGLADQCTLIGPAIRMSTLWHTGVGARLIRSGPNAVQLQIFSYANLTVTPLATSAAQSLDGAGTFSDCTIRLYEDGTSVTAVLNWPGQALVATNLTVSVTTATGAGNSGVGVITTQTSNGSDVTDWRTLNSISYQKYIPATRSVLYGLAGTDANATDSNRYFLPAGWESTSLNTSTGVATVSTGFLSSGSDPTYIAIDGTNDVIWDAAADTANVFTFIRPSAGVVGDVECFLTPTATTGTDGLGAAFKVGADGRSGIFVLAQVPANTGRSQTGCCELTTGTIHIVVAGAIVHTINLSASSADNTLGRVDTAWRVSYDALNNRIVISQNDVERLTYTFSAGEQTTIAGLTGTESAAVLQTTAILGIGMKEFRFTQASDTLAPTTNSLLVVADGTVGILTDGVFTIPVGGTNAVSSDLHTVQAQQAYRRVFMVDGSVAKVYSRITNLVTTWTPTAGSLPGAARLICLYRGRLVLSGVTSDPHNWFMSKSGDPFDWDYSPATPNALQAVAGNNSLAGLVGDVITALIPISDDVMYFGGDSSIYQMTGDPAAGGVIDLVSDKTGVLFGRAWAKDPHGVLYFAGVDGIYRMVPSSGEPPVNITKGRLERRFRDLDLSAVRVYLEWDYLRAGLVVNIVPADTSEPGVMYFWDSRAGEQGAWWPEEYPASMGPSVVYAFDGARPEDQALLYGCHDGYIRTLDDDAADDDGTAIESRVRFPLFLAPDHSHEVILSDIMPVLAAGSGVVDIDVYTGQTAEDCVTATAPRVSRTLSRAGRSQAIRQRIRGYAVQLAISGGSRWALEGLTCGFDAGGRPRREARP